MISLERREHPNGYADVMTPNELLDKGESLFQRRRREIVSANQLRGSISRFDERGDEESQAADKRADMVLRRTQAEIGRVEAELAIKNFILEAAEVIKAERAMEVVTRW